KLRTTRSAQPDGHDDTNEAVESLENAGTDLVLQFEEHLVLRQCLERIHHEEWIEGHLELGATVADRHRFVGLTEIGTLRGDLQEIRAELELYGIGLLAANERRTMHAL